MFEKIIGYENEKAELAKFCDVIININYYKSLGISIPKGIILSGEPGLGKTTFAYSIIEACNVPYYILRKNADSAQFIVNMREVFEAAKKNAPSIILLDDMDKFGNGDKYAPEYTSLQGAIDDYKSSDIFIIATVNELYVLPPSLTRVGRFDRIITFQNPVKRESSMISNYYLDSKKINIDPSIDRNLLGKLFEGYSCATIESIINMAAMASVYERNQYITMNNIVDTILNVVYSKPKVYIDDRTWEEKYRLAIHEAGKAVVTYFLNRDYLSIITIREKNVMLASSKSAKSYVTKDDKYFDYSRKSFQDRLNDITILFGGKVCFEMKFNTFDTECSNDLSYIEMLMEDMSYDTMLNSIPNVIRRDGTPKLVNGQLQYEYSDKKITMNDVYEYCMNYAKNILSTNWMLVESIARLLVERTTITIADIDNLINGNIHLQSSSIFTNLIEG